MFPVAIDPALHPGAETAADACFNVLLELVEEARRAGSIVSDDARTTARIAWAHIHGVTDLASRAGFGFKTRKETNAFIVRATEALLTGIAR
jgi:Tetracyclin repressor-like, C-terminal domain